MQFELLQVDKDIVAVEFQVLRGGNKNQFLDNYKRIMQTDDFVKLKDSAGPSAPQPKLEEKLSELEVK